MAAPTHRYVPGLAGMLVRMYARIGLFRNSYTFFSASIHNLTVIRHLMHNPKQYVKTQIFRAAGNPKGLRPFWSF